MLTEVTVEMSDFNEVPVVSKPLHLVEEILLRKEVTDRVVMRATEQRKAELGAAVLSADDAEQAAHVVYQHMKPVVGHRA
ncbi:MAG: hypothetical protein QOI16_4316 [Pseudonocardiales bacterium]|nr:hypothetical protein [Pseudonocardiales bacterium]